MVVKNTELTFRVRRLEEQNADLEKQKKEIVSDRDDFYIAC